MVFAADGWLIGFVDGFGASFFGVFAGQEHSA
jgi:hypothetical protein